MWFCCTTFVTFTLPRKINPHGGKTPTLILEKSYSLVVSGWRWRFVSSPPQRPGAVDKRVSMYTWHLRTSILDDRLNVGNKLRTTSWRYKSLRGLPKSLYELLILLLISLRRVSLLIPRSIWKVRRFSFVLSEKAEEVDFFPIYTVRDRLCLGPGGPCYTSHRPNLHPHLTRGPVREEVEEDFFPGILVVSKTRIIPVLSRSP